MKRFLHSIARSINPSLGHVDSCCIVGVSLFVFGWRNPNTGSDINLRVALDGSANKLFPAFRLDIDRADVSTMFGAPVTDQLGSCWVFDLSDECFKGASRALCALYLRKLNTRTALLDALLVTDTQSGLFSALNQEQRSACARAAKGEFVGLKPRIHWTIRPLDKTSDRMNEPLVKTVQDVASWQSGLYLKLDLPKNVTLEEVIYTQDNSSVSGFFYKLPETSVETDSFIVAFNNISHVDGVLTIRKSSGEVVKGQLKCQPATHLSSALKLLLGSLDFRSGKTVDWLNHSAFSQLVTDLKPSAPSWEAIRVEKFNQSQSPESIPECSVIIPVYGRLDLIRYQIHAFSAFPNKHAVEYVFFLDDPSIEAEFFSIIRQLSKLFPLSITAVYVGKNLGFGLANNTAVTAARAQRLLLLNSDVFPMSSGWVDRLLAAFVSKPDIGILGAKLVFEDGSIQHVGMAEKIDAEFPSIVLNDHPHKRVQASLVSLKSIDECKLLTGACMMIDTQEFLALGGFDSEYLIGDFEDSDLCQRMLEHGKKNYILNAIELIHVERLSQSLGMTEQWKQNLTLFNGWLYTRKWHGQLEAGQ